MSDVPYNPTILQPIGITYWCERHFYNRATSYPQCTTEAAAGQYYPLNGFPSSNTPVWYPIRNLTDADIEAIAEKVVEKLAARLGYKISGLSNSGDH